jgi:hypothetical protein
MWRVAGLLALACQDYSVGNKQDPPVTPPAPEPTTEPEPEPDPPVDSAPPVDSGLPPAPVSCADVDLSPVAWLASGPFATADDPVDLAGLPFHAPGFSPDGWTPVVLPDRNTPIGFDRAFRGTLDLPVLPPGAVLDLQSDDGLWVWVNGTFVGHWGGDFQQEGCVNENAECLVTITVAPPDVTSLLVPGTNVIAGRVSNPVQNSWFEVTPLCVEVP